MTPREARPCGHRGCPETVTRRNARYCSQACRQADWRQRHGLILQTVRKASPRRKSREGRGVRVYLSTNEAESLLVGNVLASVRAKVQGKLRPADPIPGQQSIYDAITEDDDASRNETSAA